MKRKDYWNMENEVNVDYVKSIELAKRLREDLDLIQARIDELKRLTEQSECDNPDLVKHREVLIEYMLTNFTSTNARKLPMVTACR